MKTLRIPTAALALATLIACSATGTASDQPSLETQHGYKIHHESLLLTVTSHGCTKPGHFVATLRQVDDVQTLAITRTRADVCRMMPYAKTVEIAVPTLTQDTAVRILNPIATFESIPREQ